MMSDYNIKIEDTYQIQNKQKLYDFDSCIAYVLERGKQMYNNNFVINRYHKEALYQVLAYAIEDQKVTQELGMSLDKGLLLMGESNCGKTSLMHLMKPFFSHKRQYNIKTCRSLSVAFMQKGFEAIAPFELSTCKPVCLDNVGMEHIAKHYGYSCEVVSNIVESHYENRHEQTYPRLHITTSMSPSELEKRYGTHFRKMLQQMFNVVVFR
ncbi:MAG: hypothetical protein LBI72_07635 [Flavobacteriaceae bacterium]|jgi:energy-coupling factor transporter ATP-binding protein EcfA2|nr:hypothetical protein [Flavobacteriaceae bacterium]